MVTPHHQTLTLINICGVLNHLTLLHVIYVVYVVYPSDFVDELLMNCLLMLTLTLFYISNSKAFASGLIIKSWGMFHFNWYQ